jgi:hypothetical protein
VEQPSSLMHSTQNENKEDSEFSLSAITVANSHFDPSALINKHEYYELMRAALAEAELELQKELNTNKTTSKKFSSQSNVSPQSKNKIILLATLSILAIITNAASQFLIEEGQNSVAARRQIEETFTHESSLIYATDFLFSKTIANPNSEIFHKNLEDLNQIFDYRVQHIKKLAHFNIQGFKNLGEKIVYEKQLVKNVNPDLKNNSSANELENNESQLSDPL